MDLAELAVIATALVAVGFEDVRLSGSSDSLDSRLFQWPRTGTSKAYLDRAVDLVPDKIGGAIFVGYNVAAVVLTVSVLQSLQHAYRTLSPARKSSTGFRVRLAVLSIMAIAAFASLSYNMLSFLLMSYRAWSSTSIASAALAQRIWQWTTTSRLFYAFSTSLLKSHAGFWWTRQGLLASMLCSLFMSIEGRRRKATFETIPLLRLFLLNQILPASFAQSLFFIALLLREDSSHTLDHLLVTRAPLDAVPITLVTKDKGQKRTLDLEAVSFWDSLRDRTSVLIPLVPYAVLLVSAPMLVLSRVSQLKDDPWVIPGVVTLRLLLFLPYYLPSSDTKAKGYETWRHTLVAIAFYICARNVASLVAQPSLISSIDFEGDFAATGESFAVKALGRDYIVWQAVVLIWSLISWIRTD